MKHTLWKHSFGSTLWKLDLASGKSVEVKINIASDDKENNLETLAVNSEADSYHLSPSGRRAVKASHSWKDRSVEGRE